ncbi:SEC-C metal-binding domain-containing protein [Streptomyces sp. NPDC056352]|uniref:SEC-C metal-binding domain-containing protein n=1 Tax=Streptomyces sp. NPDC056352 TaxID=3345791 RepID=UPI0035D8486D
MWPPARNEPCWCDSGRKYKKCCGTPAKTRRTDRSAPVTAVHPNRLRSTAWARHRALGRPRPHPDQLALVDHLLDRQRRQPRRPHVLSGGAGPPAQSMWHRGVPLTSQFSRMATLHRQCRPAPPPRRGEPDAVPGHAPGVVDPSSSPCEPGTPHGNQPHGQEHCHASAFRRRGSASLRGTGLREHVHGPDRGRGRQ